MIFRLLKSLFPIGIVFTLFGDIENVLLGISDSLERPKLYLKNSINESQPINAIDTLDKWYDDFNVKYDTTDTLINKQLRISQIATAIGGQNLTYLRERVNIAFPQIEISEFSAPTSNMVGLGMVGQIQVSDYPGWIPNEFQYGSYPTGLFRVTGKVDSQIQYTQLKDIIARYFPLRLQPVYVDIAFIQQSGVVGIGVVGLVEVGRTVDDI